MIASFESLGFLFIIPFYPGLNPNAVAGNPSVTRLTHKSCTDVKH